MAMTPREALDYLTRHGVPLNGDLDHILAEEVHDVKSDEADAINRNGREEQLGYLLYGRGESEKVLDKIIADYKFLNDDTDALLNTRSVA